MGKCILLNIILYNYNACFTRLQYNRKNEMHFSFLHCQLVFMCIRKNRLLVIVVGVPVVNFCTFYLSLFNTDVASR